MLRRPPGEGRLVADQRRGKVLLALAFFVLPWLTLADAQQQHPKQQQLRYHQPQVANILHGNAPAERHPADVHRRLKNQEDGDYDVARSSDDRREPPSRPRYGSSPLEDDHALGKLAATVAPSGRQGRDTVTTAHHGRDKKYGVSQPNNDYPNHHDASALATVAPDFPVRASKSPRQLTSILSGAGLSSPHSARSLERWEVEDYVLVATVDGHLHALSKDSGDERWHLQVVQPTVETLHHRPNNTLGEDYRYHPLDDYIWAVEPTQDGPVYVWMPSGVGSGLMPTGFTMKQLVDELGPYAVPNPPVVYTGDKKTTMVSMDAATGRVLKWFGQGSSQVEEGATCFPPNGLVDSQSEACGNTGTITLSRTEYTVSIHRQDDGRPLATLRYSEWGPNSFDQDLHRQYRTTQDNRVLTSASNGRLYSVDAGNVTAQSPLRFLGPAARVFDVARPDDVPAGSNPELVLLPQPRPPVAPGDGARTKAVYLNRTESGSWFAMSSFSYPLMANAPLAQIHSRDRFEGTWSYDDALVEKALVGNHLIGSVQEDTDLPNDLVPWSSLPPGLPDRQDDDEVHDYHDNASLQVHDPESDLTIVDKFRTIPEYAYARVLDIVLNPLLIPIILCAIWAARYGKPGHRRLESGIATSLEASSASSDDVATYVGREAPAEVPTHAQVNVPGEDAAKVPPADRSAVPETGADVRTEPNSEMPQDGSPLQAPLANGESPEKKKKKTHRGTRGGTKHKKKKQDTSSQSSDDRSNNGPTDEDINRIKHIPPETQLKPNVKSVVDDPRDVSAAGFETTNGLRVNLDDQLGMGSNGTVVYSGTFHMREVAVKRMLAVFYDIAYQETQLLLESDNHPNVIQYYAFHQENAFLYIALERCHASLADIVDKPHMHRELARAGEMDIPHVLLQIANGLSHLHNLRIVHRDLKPQNILVTMTKDGRPRLVVSDFGLCKKLDGAQSSFGATTAHAAGTSGWRAPELLLDDDARESSHSMTSSHHSESSQLISSGLIPNRRATRAIDIFSLGLVFFYVLTKGSHPFDCGDRYMREVNIRKGQLNLQPLDVLGDYAFEAENLIRLMLQSEPRQRPNIREVMAHPFFWDAKKRLTFLCDVSDHFEKEQRDPPSEALVTLEKYAPDICRGDFLKCLTKDFVESLGKQRKYTGSRLLDLLRALRNKWNHREDMSEALKKSVGTSYEEYLGYWTRRFPNLLVISYDIIYMLDLQDATRFREYFEPMKP